VFRNIHHETVQRGKKLVLRYSYTKMCFETFIA
jgi:hypothetical protein